mmetsp:Transcript_19134/g.63247  ORF Transcript_19134/g.63247 Transcript_19134/m.63247 type:complete len:169 (+) Transcript_19134:81-587(+)
MTMLGRILGVIVLAGMVHGFATIADPAPPTGAPKLRECEVLGGGNFSGSDDITLWRDGLAFVGFGVNPADMHKGVMGIDLSATPPVYTSLLVEGMPVGLAPAPHGLFVEQSTQRLYFNSLRCPTRKRASSCSTSSTRAAAPSPSSHSATPSQAKCCPSSPPPRSRGAR